MPFIRTVSYTSGYTRIDNRTIRDPKLSFQSGGLLDYLLSLPNDWVISLAHLSKVKETCGRTIVTNSLSDLRRLGYVLRVDYRYKGRFQTEYTVFENKESCAAWKLLNNVEDGQKFDHKPEFVLPDLSDPEDIEAKEENSRLKPKKSRKNSKTDEQLQAEAAAKEAERQAKAEERARQKELKEQEKAEKERLKQEKIEQDKTRRYAYFGSQERYTNFTRWYWGFYVKGAGAGLSNPGLFFDIVLDNLLSGGEKYRSLVFQFEAAEKEHQKKLDNDRQNTIATERAKTLERQNQPVQEQSEATQETVIGQMPPKEFLRPDDLEWFESSNLKDDLLAGCIAELNHMKDHWVMHRSIISKYRKPQQARDLGLVSVNNR